MIEESSELERYAPGRIDDEGQGIPLWSIALILIVVAVLGYIVYDAMKSETYFYEVDQALAVAEDLPGRTVRIKGVVEQGSIIGNDGELMRKFRIAEKGKSLDVVYHGAMPDTFAEDMEVVITGTVNEDLVLEADEVLVKCPSRYEGAPPTGMKKGPQASL